MTQARHLPITSAITRVFVIARPDFRIDGMINLLNTSDAHEVISCALPGQQCWEQVQTTRPDVLLIQREALSASIAATLQQCRQKSVNTPLVLFGDPVSEQELNELIRLGLNGYIANDTPTSQLLLALNRVAEGQIWTERRVLENIVRDANQSEQLIAESMRNSMEELASTLTRRERQVLLQILNGCTTREIADALHLSQQGVKLHLGRIFNKFNVSNRTQLVLEAYRRITPVPDVLGLFRQTLLSRPGANHADSSVHGGGCGTHRGESALRLFPGMNGI